MPLVSFFSNSKLDTLAFGERDVWFVTLSNDKDICQPSSESMSVAILDMDNVERTLMSLPGHNSSHSSTVSSSSDHAQVSSVKSDCVLDLATCNVYLNTVMHPHCWIRVTDGRVREVKTGPKNI